MIGSNFNSNANKFMNTVKEAAKDLDHAVKSLSDKTASTGGKAAASPIKATKNFVDEKAREMDAVGKAFDKSMVAGLLASYRAMSPGNQVTDILNAVGFELAPSVQSGVSATLNAVPGFGLAGLFDIMDLMKSEPHFTIPRGEVPSSHWVPPPSTSCPGSRRPNGDLIKYPTGYAETKPGATKPDLKNPKTVRALLAQIEKLNDLLTRLVGGLEGKIPGPNMEQLTGKPETNEAEEVHPFENIPENIPFEEFVFLLMMAIVKDQQKDIKALTKELAENARQRDAASAATSAAKANQTNTQVTGIAVEAIGGAGGQMGSAAAKIVSTQANAAADAKVESMKEKEEKLKDSRTELMERLKFEMQKLQELQQSMSNVLNAMHDGAMGTIRNIK